MKVLGGLACLILIGVLCLALSSRGTGTQSASTGGPSGTVREYWDAINAGSFDGAWQCIYPSSRNVRVMDSSIRVEIDLVKMGQKFSITIHSENVTDDVASVEKTYYWVGDLGRFPKVAVVRATHSVVGLEVLGGTTNDYILVPENGTWYIYGITLTER